jgi:hypothetical protein
LLRGSWFLRAQVELHFFDRSSEHFRHDFGVTELWHDRQTVVGSDVHASIRGEPERNSMLELPFGFLFAIDEKPACAASGKLARSIGGELVPHIDFAVRQLIAASDRVQFQTKETIGVLQPALFDIKREAAKETGLGNNNACYPGTDPPVVV